ncbi:MAG: hypothetical protein ACK56I_30150, partial [bacterium]
YHSIHDDGQAPSPAEDLQFAAEFIPHIVNITFSHQSAQLADFTPEDLPRNIHRPPSLDVGVGLQGRKTFYLPASFELEVGFDLGVNLGFPVGLRKIGTEARIFLQ